MQQRISMIKILMIYFIQLVNINISLVYNACTTRILYDTRHKNPGFLRSRVNPELCRYISEQQLHATHRLYKKNPKETSRKHTFIYILYWWSFCRYSCTIAIPISRYNFSFRDIFSKPILSLSVSVRVPSHISIRRASFM